MKYFKIITSMFLSLKFRWELRSFMCVLAAPTLLVSNAFAQPDAPEGLNSEALRTWLKTEWYNPYFNDLGYNGARTQMFGYTDELNSTIHCIYTGFEQPSEFTTYLDPINTEHIIPQSFFGGISPMKSDLFNIRPSHGSANSSRGNSPYSEIADENAQWYGTNASGAYVTQSNVPEDPENWSKRSGSLWEPKEDVKGDIARKVFYFYTMYPTQAGEISTLGNPEMFYAWHLEDPVSAFEATRNDRIQEVQGNANPYISHPDWVETAWFWSGAVINGCTDPIACNYSETANTDDGTCFYPETGLDCDGNALASCSLFFSEYAEGSSNNKYLEIYNPGVAEVSLEGYALAHTVNAPAVPGTYETWVELPTTATIAPGSVFRVVHSQATLELLNNADFTYSSLSNGDDGFGLVYGTPTDFDLLDIIGDWNADPGSGWPVAGIDNATANHTLIRKPDVLDGNNGDWIASAGTNEADSEWVVLESDDWSDFGLHSADGTCSTEVEVSEDVMGCMYAAACNFDPSATLDNGACDFISCEVPGCTYMGALNFEPLATFDDGSCLFNDNVNTCSSDINGDNLITVGDLLLLLTDFGGTCP
ncbi:endonuclease [Flavobacteriales bacterium]|nr:endonuclease [Flavobacteriales bacterium]